MLPKRDKHRKKNAFQQITSTLGVLLFYYIFLLIFYSKKVSLMTLQMFAVKADNLLQKLGIIILMVFVSFLCDL